MALAFNQLVSPLNQASWLQYLLSALQGIGPTIQSPGPNTNQLLGTGSFSITGPAQTASQVVILITTTGNASGTNPAFFQYSVDGGLTFNPSAPVSMGSLSGNGFAYAIPGINISITFLNGSYTTAGSGGFSFVAGERYSFTTNTPTFPITNWPAIGVGNAMTQIDAQAMADLNILVAQAIAGGFTQSWINPPLVNGVPTPPPDGWLDLLAQSFYNRQRGAALQTQGVCFLLAAPNAGPYTILPGQLFASSANGQFVFTNVGGTTITKGGSAFVTFQALNPGAAYNQVESYGIGASGYWITSLLTPLAGISITNPLQSSPTVGHSGTGAGTVSAEAGFGGPAGEYSVIIKIVGAGTAGSSGSFQFSTDSGTTYSSVVAPIPSTAYTLGATNMNATFSGVFVASDIYAFSTAWITQYGVDTQSSLSFAVACQNQWATLSPSSPAGQYVLWAQAASPEVVNAYVIPDPVTPGQVDITLIGANNGPVSSTAITAVTNYIQARVGLCITISVGTVTVLTINTEAAYIICRSAYRNTVQNSIQALFNIYADSLLPQSTVDLSVVAGLVNQAQGVVEINPLSSFKMNPGGAGYAAADIPLLANQTASLIVPALSCFQFV